ncbi:MAG: cysteine-rich small domain-containing protein [Epsilonproteobacteria bacterium]|nr:cysteine-rich small domain-containing protein [Campylobacterota bacterium]
MTYKEWFDAHALKHAAIMKKLTSVSDAEVLKYFRFENMVIHEPNFCLLYADNTKCHEIDELNCYWCACPYFRFNDQGLEIIEDKTLYSTCSIHSKEGAQFISDQSIHQDCTGCLIPHHEKILKKEFNRDWRITMEKAPYK